MLDQAEKLREIMDKTKKKNNDIMENDNKTNAKVICITSGKGGVGKTNISVNLALNLSSMGKKVVVFDADFGLANVDVIFGISVRYNLTSVLSGEKSILDILAEGPNGVKFISGGSGIRELTNLTTKELDNFINGIKQLNNIADIIIIDTGAGISESVINLIISSDKVFVVTTPEPTSFTDAYALIKTVNNMGYARDIGLIVNRAEDKKEGNEIYLKINNVCKRFLNVNLINLGYVPYDMHVVKAIKMQTPFTIEYPNCNASKQINNIAYSVINNGIQKEKGEISFFNRFLSYLK